MKVVWFARTTWKLQ